MSTMTMKLPQTYVEVEKEEMQYVDGGGTLRIRISDNSMIISILSAVGGTLTIAKATAALTAAATAISTSIFLGSAGTLTLYAGAFLLGFGSVIPTIAGAAVAYGVNGLKGRTFDVVSLPGVPNFTVSI